MISSQDLAVNRSDRYCVDIDFHHFTSYDNHMHDTNIGGKIMKKTELGHTGIYVTPAAFGVLTMGASQLDLSLEKGAQLIKYAFSKGINLFDTAQYYDTYHYIKEAFKDIDMSVDNKNRPVICTKSLASSYEDMRFAVEEAQEKMGLDVIDIFLIHEVRQDPDWDMRQPAWQCLMDFRKKGIIKSIGVSTHHVDVVEKMAGIPECDVVFPLINFAGLGIRKGDDFGTREEMESSIEKCRLAGKGIFIMKAFGGGNLTGEYIKALDYAFSIKGTASVMVGLGSIDEIDRLISYTEGTLPKDYAPDISKKKIHIDQGDCEGCGACVSRCPNKAVNFGRFGLAQIDYDICITCGYCAPVCPVRAIIMY